MDSMVLIVSGIVIIILLIVVVVISSKGGKNKNAGKRKSSSSYKSSIEIDPAAIASRIFKLAPSELKKAKDVYIGKQVEIRTILSSSKGSKHGNTYRAVVLDYQDNRNFHVLGDINMKDYKDQSWMTREGKLKIKGVVKEIHKTEIILEKIKII